VSRIQRFRPTGAAVVTGAVIGAMALAGCGAGQITQTSTQVPSIVGANAGNQSVVVRDAHIEFADEAKGANIYPRGGAAPLQMSIVNTGGEPDRLVSASSPAAASVEISGEAEIASGRVLLIEGEPAAAAAPAPASAAPPASGSARPTPAGGAPTSGEPSAPGDEIGGSGQEPGAPAPGSPGPAAPSTPTAEAPAAAAPPATASPLPGQREGQVVLTGLKEDIRAGLTYPVVLNFERAGQITLNVPVGYPSEPREDEPAE
jgi:copper(I)-binding protein